MPLLHEFIFVFIWRLNGVILLKRPRKKNSRSRTQGTKLKLQNQGPNICMKDSGPRTNIPGPRIYEKGL